MRTIDELRKEIDDIEHEIHNTKMTKAQENKLRKRVPWLRTCIKYLESNPKESFIKDQIEDVTTRINLRMSYFVLDDAESKPKSFVSKMRKAHETMYEIPKLRDQVRTLRYLLK